MANDEPIPKPDIQPAPDINAAMLAHLEQLTAAVETLLIHARWQAGEMDRAMYDELRERIRETNQTLRKASDQ